MNKPVRSDRLLYIMLRAQLLAKQESNDGGYAMLIVSILMLTIFSLLSACLTMTNISRASTKAHVEGTSTFYAAESGLNQRANAVRQKFINYGVPKGDSPGVLPGQIASAVNMAACVDGNTANDGSEDFACETQDLNYRHSSGTKIGTGGDGKSLTATDYNDNVKYTAYTFAADRTIYTNPVLRIPQVTTVPAGQAFAGLSAQEYRYTVYSMATSKQPQDIDAKATTILEMTFKNRAIPLFQFAAFYDGDLEMNSASQMDITGRVHTNGNLYVQPTPITTETTRLLSLVTVTGQIYNRVDAAVMVVPRFGTTLVLMTGDPTNPDAVSNTYLPLLSDSTRTTAISPPEIATFQGKVLDGAAGVSRLQLPQPGFLRKRDNDNNIGEYYGKADLRLEMVPKRAAGNVPFNFTAIRSGGTGGSCATFDISVGRQGTINCNQLNEGQLRSLQQPVMVKVATNEERERFCPSLTTNYNPSADGDRQTLRALQVAIAAQNTPVPFSQLNLPLSDSANASISTIATSLNSLDTDKSPVQIAAEKGGCFLPAPIQILTGSGTANANYNWQSSYYDRRENRWMGMLQTNIASLTVWNRDGLYVDRDNDLTTNDPTTTAQDTAAFNSGNPSSTYDTDNLLFIRAAANSTAPTGSFQKLGLGAADTSEGGLVYYATVSDDLDGNGTIDITTDPVDKLRIYPDGSKRQSPYGFAISDGANLPGPISVVSDRALYLQGDYNNFATNTAKQPAALIGDTITVLSNSCLDADLKINCGILSGQNLATETTVNAAFLSFTDISSGNLGTPTFGGTKSYSGGLNNYTRMVENWSDLNFNYTGSLVSLGKPQEFSGAYIPGSVVGYYDVPNRNFSYETNFNAFNLLPPLTPKVLYLQQDIFKRVYN